MFYKFGFIANGKIWWHVYYNLCQVKIRNDTNYKPNIEEMSSSRD